MSQSESISALPWHHAALDAVPDPSTMHHGLMISGLSGIGKREFSIALARRLLCMHPVPADCGATCQGCQLFDAGTHPDLHILCTEQETASGRIPLLGAYSNRYQDIAARERRTNPSQIIPIDYVRSLIGRLVQSAHIAARRVAIVVEADRMNTSAANALLKLLEEPPEDSFLLLVSARPEALPATVRSRCLSVALPGPVRQAALDWLKEQENIDSDLDQLEAALDAGGAGPFDLLGAQRSGRLVEAEHNSALLAGVLSGREDPVAAAAGLYKQETVPMLEWLQRAVGELIRREVGSNHPPMMSGLYALYGKVGRYRNMARDQLNVQLALEDVLIGLSGLYRDS